jgi:hypothetical protein
MHRKHHEESDALKAARERKDTAAIAFLEKRETSDKVQPYDHAKGFDESQYDMSKGEIGNPAVPNPHAPAVAPLPENQSTGLCVECGKPVAPGQNYVCRDHVRGN